MGASNNVIRIPPEGRATTVIDRFGDGAGNALRRPNGLHVDAAGNVYVVGARTNNAFRVTPEGDVTQLVDRLGPGDGYGLNFPNGVTADAAGNAYAGEFHEAAEAPELAEAHRRSAVTRPVSMLSWSSLRRM